MTEKGIAVSAPAKSAPSSAKDAFDISNSPNKLVAASSENNVISSQSSLTEDYYDCQVAEEEDLRGEGGQVEVSSKAVKAAAAAVVVYSTVNKQVT